MGAAVYAARLLVNSEYAGSKGADHASGGTPLGLRLRPPCWTREHVGPLTELLVFADRAHVRVVRPALSAGQIVLSDRYADATVAYQGAGRAFRRSDFRDRAIGSRRLKPDLTLLFDLSVDDCVARLKRRTARVCRATGRWRLSIFTRVRQAYLDIAAAEPQRVRIIDTSGPVEATQARVRELVTEFLRMNASH